MPFSVTTKPSLWRRACGRAMTALLASVLLVGSGVTGLSVAAASGPTPPPRSEDSTSAVESCPRVAGHMACLSVHQPLRIGGASTGAVRDLAVASAMTAYGPRDLASAYRIPPSSSTATVAIVNAFDAPTVEADLAVYRAHYGLPTCSTANGCFTKVNQRGQAHPLPSADAGWAEETGLDVEMVSAVCPTCHILLVEADNDALAAANIEASVKTATAKGARYVSMSWGTDESQAQLGFDRTYLSVPGVTYVAASGDADYGTSWPAASPNVVSVGGTSLYRSTKAVRGWTESVWGYTDGTGTGSGCSSVEPKPTYQRSVSPTLCTHRALNDVSVVGDPATGVAVYQDGSWWQFGGTSAGSPIIAAMYALAGPATATPSPSYPYAHGGSFNDVLGAANGYCGNALCTAGRGWDGPSGIGSPIGVGGFASVYSILVHNPRTVTGYTGSAVALDVRASDSGRLAVRYSATGLPAGTVLRSSGIINGAPTAPGQYVVTVTGRDSRGSNGATTFRWTVADHRIVAPSVPHLAGPLRRHSAVTAVFGSFREDTVRGRVIQPVVRLQWYLDGKAIPGATHSRLAISATYLHHQLSFGLTASAKNHRTYRYLTARSALIA